MAAVRPDDDLMLGLYLNKDRVFMRQALAVTCGIGAALGGKGIPAAWWGALTDDPGLAKQLAERQAAARKEQRGNRNT